MVPRFSRVTGHSQCLSNSRQNSQENAYPLYSVDEIWSSNKQFNTRVTSHADEKKISITEQRQVPRTSTYRVPNGQVVHERVYGATKGKKLHLCVAVNGASKSMRGQLPLSNLNLTNGDFGDDAGMIVENRDYCFVGSSSTEIESIAKKGFSFFRLSRWSWWQSFTWNQSC